ncbi:MAG TPA: VWA domain-containing protein [Tepidisphaeraceae bacterium]|nr:VWA domain-containing protein [Tepidisphaeraceae bacterium]
MTQTSAPLPQPKTAGTSPPSATAANPAEPGNLPPNLPNPEEAEHYHPQPTFWQRKWVINGMPIATSVVFYVGLFILMIVLENAFRIVVFQKAAQDQVVVPTSELAENTPPGAVQFTGLNNDPLHQAFQDKDPDHGSVKGFSDTKGPSVDPSAMGGGSGDASNSIIATGAASGFGSGKNGHGAGTGEGNGSGQGEGGPLAMFGHPGGGGLGPNGPVFGHGGNALTIAFVCDASGSMMEKMEALKRELSKAVEGLHPFQKFSITFFQNQSATDIDPSLILATPENKRKAESFLDGVSTNGTTDPIPGLEIAFHQHPQLVYLLTDGDFPDNAKVLTEIHKLNPDNKIKVNTIAFTDSADRDVDFKKLLKQIAEESGGTFKAVNEEDLN